MEEKAFKLILESGDEGILQSDMWRKLKASSREGSRISLRLEARNLIKRERELSNGRWTYRIFIKRKPLEIDSLIDIPCMICENIQKCERNGEISPASCVSLTKWLLSKIDNCEQG